MTKYHMICPMLGSVHFSGKIQAYEALSIGAQHQYCPREHNSIPVFQTEAHACSNTSSLHTVRNPEYVQEFMDQQCRLVQVQLAAVW